MTNQIVEIQISEITNPPFHDRNTVNLETIKELAENINATGLINPIIVREKDGKFERISGFRRLEAYKLLARETIPAIVMKLDDKEAALLMISENIQREDLNAYDETTAIISLLSITLDISEEETKKVVTRMCNVKAGKTTQRSTDELRLKQILDVLKKIGKITLDGLRARMPLLSLRDEVVQLMRNDGMMYTIALELNKIKNESLLATIVKEKIWQTMSIRELKDYIKSNENKQEREVNPLKELDKELRGSYFKLSIEKRVEINTHIEKIKQLLASVNF